jgi:hypothetical protein
MGNKNEIEQYMNDTDPVIYVFDASNPDIEMFTD